MSAPYRPGQQWPNHGPQRPERPPPIQFQQEEPPAKPNRTLQWVLRAAGLVVVAVVSGLVWYYINNDTTSTPTNNSGTSTTPRPQGVYQFTPHEKMPEPDRVKDCAEHAYGDIEVFLQETPCNHLTRQLFVTKDDGGRTIYTSVSIVVMETEDEAKDLRDLTDKDGSGNVNDVVRDKVVEIEGVDKLSTLDGYASNLSGRKVIIIESDLAEQDKSEDEDADEAILDSVSDDALRLAEEVDSRSGSG